MKHSFPRQAMVLAAGLGKRMRPLTDHVPKPMIEVAGRTLIDRTIDELESAGVEKIVVNTSYKAEILEAHLLKRSSPQLIFSREETPLETGGGVARALSHFGETPFFAVNGDVIWLNGPESALHRLSAAWDNSMDALLLLNDVDTAVGYDGKGDFFVDAAGNIIRRRSDQKGPYVYAGVQILHPRLFQSCPDGAFSLNVLYDKAMKMQPPRIRALIHNGFWLHVGDVKGKEQAEERLRQLF